MSPFKASFIAVRRQAGVRSYSMMSFSKLTFASLLSFCLLSQGQAQEANAVKKSWKATKSSMLQDDFPFTSACIGADVKYQEIPRLKNGQPVLNKEGKPVIDRKEHFDNVANKGIAIILGNEAFACFDTDLLRMSAGWTGGYITTRGVAFDGAHGGFPSVAGPQQFSTPQLPGWVSSKDGFKDPRTDPYGPISASLGRWDGLYVVGMEVVLSYTVHGTKIYEYPSSVTKDGATGFVRTFKTEKTKEALSLLVCEVNGATGAVNGDSATLEANDNVTTVGVVGAPKGAKLVTADNRIVLQLPKGAAASTFKVVIAKTAKADAGKFAALLEGAPKMIEFAKGGAAHWPQAVETKGVLAASTTPDGAYVTDKLTTPDENPWKRRVRIGGMDFFADGKRAAVSTWDGDIWIVSGIDDKLEKLTWKRFASGGYETLGLKIVNDVIYTSGRNQITRYYDLNGDGEADYYENFNNDITSSTGFHEFVFDLQADKDGNFFFAKAGPVRGGGRGFADDGNNQGWGHITAHAGTLLKVSKDGKKFEVYATGFRAPNGIGISPEGQVTTSDNEGTWVPSTPINWVKKGGYYGVEDTAHVSPIPEFKQPLCWLPHNGPVVFDNSGGGQAWVTSNNWGPFAGDMLHLSYGKCRLYVVLKEEVKGQMQGGVVQIPVQFTSSAMRGHFNPKDGQLYIVGLKGWQTDAANATGFDRVRFTGKPYHSVSALHVLKTGVQLTFTEPLDAKDAADVQNYSVKRWNYDHAEHYGSPEFNVTDPKKTGREPVEVKSAKLSEDGKTVTLELADVQPVMQQWIQFNITAKDGTTIKQDIVHTINAVP